MVDRRKESDDRIHRLTDKLEVRLRERSVGGQGEREQW